MNIDEIMVELKAHRLWSSKGQDGPELVPCSFCGGKPYVRAHNSEYGLCGATVKCSCCGAQGPAASIYALIITPGKLSTPLLPESLERGIEAAIEAWNSGSADKKRLGNLRLPA